MVGLEYKYYRNFEIGVISKFWSYLKHSLKKVQIELNLKFVFWKENLYFWKEEGCVPHQRRENKHGGYNGQGRNFWF